MYAHEVSAAPVQAGVVLELRLRVEPRLHGRPLVRRVAGTAGAWAGPRPPAQKHPASGLHVLLHFSPNTSRTHTHTHTGEHRLRGLCTITKAKLQRKLLDLFHYIHEKQQSQS